MDKNYLTTGEFAKLCHTSKDTLFHYCDIGLFTPAKIQENGYRYYHVLQYDTFLTIRRLHLIGMPLNRIREYMQARTPEKMVELFSEQESLLNQQIERLQRIKTLLHTQKVGMEQALLHPAGEFFVLWQDSRLLLCSNQIQEVDDYVMTEEIGALIASVGNQIQPNTLGMVCDLEEAIRSETCPCRFYICAEELKSQQCITMPAGKYFCTYHRGGYETLWETYRELQSQAEQQGLALGASVYAETVIGDWAVTSSEEYVIRVFAPIL